jgi:hypothetical protein
MSCGTIRLVNHQPFSSCLNAINTVPKDIRFELQRRSCISLKGRGEWMGGAECYLPLAVVNEGRESIASHRGPATPIRHNSA